MSDYLFLSKIDNCIENYIYLNRYTPNRQEKADGLINFKVGIFLQKFHENNWHLVDEKFFDNNESLFISSLEYDLSIGELLVVVPADSSKVFEKKYDELPKPLSRKVDLSPINERTEIGYRINDSFSSYQGEFPYKMSCFKGTFLSFDPLIQHAKGITNKLIFINIFSKKIKTKDIFQLHIASANTKRKYKSYDYVNNSALIIDIGNYNDEICFYSKDTLGVPIFLSHDSNSIFSVEHTHPPSEFFWKNKFHAQSVLKSNWLNQLK